ncbi:9920_t:CDS:1, partial [Gigaspora rosea]
NTPVTQTPPVTNSNDIESKPSVKRKRPEETDQPVDMEFTNANYYESVANEANPIKIDQEELEKPTKKNKSWKSYAQNQIKERPIRTTRGPKKSRYTTVEDFESDKE